MKSNQTIHLWRTGSIVLVVALALMLPLNSTAQNAKEPVKKKEAQVKHHAAEGKTLSTSPSTNVGAKAGQAIDPKLREKQEMAAGKKSAAQISASEDRMKALKEKNRAEAKQSKPAQAAKPKEIKGTTPGLQAKTQVPANNQAAVSNSSASEKRSAYEQKLRSTGASEAAVQKKLEYFDKSQQSSK